MRCFIAIELDSSFRFKIAEIQNRLAEDAIKPVEPQNLHLTLKFLGDMSEENVNEVVKVLSTIKFDAFEMELSGIGVFPSTDRINVIWIGATGRVSELVREINLQLTKIGIPEDDRAFEAHLTIARVKRKPEKLKERLKALENIHIGAQKVTSFVLKKSTLTSQGPIYEDVRKFELVK